ncbi:hotdog fold thioesterase [Litoribacter ruber]|uniref:Hotdog fold thioesterase n=1 Tax=Litoribacter ruber TaxID=702568 RepID=A0AAP2G1I7_9BACT|nr:MULTISPECIES: hotdog fold thioesterase [Litoribacter]MBS9524719.1 hotdog fold thioesterase [Litoribacter alkaliphilus]MBT0812739.1 hotdog fold thioesterase [Litoribacter ruber]
MIFPQNLQLETLNQMSQNTMVEYLGIVFTEIGENHLAATMPVDHRTKQPMGLLHGGANVVLAETIGSVAGNFVLDREIQHCVGLDINANHLKAVKSGLVKGIATPIKLGSKIQVWEIKIYNQKNEMTCICRLTLAVLDKG